MDAELRELLPWRHPFLMVDRMIEYVPHERILTVKDVAGSDLMATAHAREAHGVAAAMILEGMNQSAALLYQLTYGKVESIRLPLLGFLKADLRGTAATGESVHYAVEAVKMTPTHGLFEGEARVGGRTLARSELAFAVASGVPSS